MKERSARPERKDRKPQRSRAAKKAIGAPSVTERVDLQSVRLRSFTAAVGDGSAAAPSGPIYAKVNFTTPEISTNQDLVKVSTTFIFSLARDEAQSAELVMVTASATTDVFYHRRDKKPLDEAQLTEFALHQMPFHCWGIWREFVQSSMSRLGLPPLTLPFYRVGDAQRLVVERQ